MADTTQITIGGVDRTADVVAGTTTVDMRLNQRWTAGFTAQSVDGSFRPVVGQRVEVWAGASRIFLGSIDQIAEQRLVEGPRAEVTYQCLCVDLSARLDQRVCDTPKTYKAVSAQYVILDVMATFASGEGISYGVGGAGGYVDNGATVDKYVVDHQSVASVVADMAALSGLVSFVDADGNLHMQTRTASAAPFSITDATLNFTSIGSRKTREDYFNEVWTRLSWAAFGSTVESFAGDGVTRSWTLAHPAAQVDSITVNGAPVDFGGDGELRPYTWLYGEDTIAQAVAETVLTAGDTLEITYREMGADWIYTGNSTEKSARAAVEGNSGSYGKSIQATDQTNATAAQDAASADLAISSAIPLVATIGTVGYSGGAITAASPLPGMVVTISVSAPAISGTFLVQEVAAQHVPGWGFAYTSTAIDGTRVGNWIDYFRNLGATPSGYITGGSGGSGPRPTSGSGSSATPDAPGNVTIVSATADDAPTNRAANGGRGIVRGINLNLTIPTPAGTFKGVHVQVDASHVAASHPPMSRSQSMGTVVAAHGPTRTTTVGNYSYAAYGDGAGGMQIRIEISEPGTLPATARTTVISYSDSAVNDVSTSPYVDVTIPALSTPKPTAGGAYCANPLTIAAGTPYILKPSARR